MALIFVGPRDERGEPAAWVQGVPARDLSDADLAELAVSETELVASGLYAVASRVEHPPARVGKEEE